MKFWTIKNEISMGRIAMISIMIAMSSELMTNTLTFGLF